ncbi:hypothetical protein PH5382_02976 [Phaeobacter sp. CECT 5382]|uniref:hypothetical protein n=1 Tax=Phaeobacter sp. CECT 5382 TaxID=1712645 RepID=UPI0006DAA6B8|nr:hypothetical protein [Phaeobacter sp. CECT 5382]CUH89031.1 hypothetical protein PH5382_02976 [Phaeobacter sp. CECT 5382]
MNLDMILRMVMRRLVGKAVNSGLSAGMNVFSGRGGKRPMAPPRAETPDEIEARAEREYQQAIKRARQARRDQA